MEPKTKQYLLITVVGVTLFVALLRLSSVLAFAAQLVDLVLPILAGGILALFINVPMTGLEKRLKRLFCKAKKQPSDKVLHLLSFFITLLGVVLVLVLALTLLIPELVQSFHSLYVQIEANIPRWTAYLSAQDADMGWLMSWLEGIDWEQLLHRVTDSIDTVLVNAVGAVSATVNIVVTASFALIISVYMSVGSESLCHHARTLVCAYLKPSHSAWLLKFCRLFRQSFANFLTGQCSEAVILGVLMALAFSVFKIPYGSLVGMLTAICAIIPYVGALISCVVSVFLVLLVDPVLAVRCLIVYLAVQFIEIQFIYPRVVGKSVGLSPLYTLVAAMIGGKLFGIIGIIFFIPLTAVITPVPHPESWCAAADCETCRLFRCRCGIDMHTKNTAALVHFFKCKSSGILLRRFRFLLQRFVHISHQNQDHQQIIRKNRDRGVVCDHTEQRRHQAVANIGAGHLNPNDRL